MADELRSAIEATLVEVSDETRRVLFYEYGVEGLVALQALIGKELLERALTTWEQLSD
jgi:hypothetical protein